MENDDYCRGDSEKTKDALLWLPSGTGRHHDDALKCEAVTMMTTVYWKTAAGSHIKKFWASQAFCYFINLIRGAYTDFTIKLRGEMAQYHTGNAVNTEVW